MCCASFSPRLQRDVKACKRRHWDTGALKSVMADLLASDERPLPEFYRGHSLTGALAGFRSLHVASAPNPPKDKWVLMYKVSGGEVIFVRTGTHDEVYGR